MRPGKVRGGQLNVKESSVVPQAAMHTNAFSETAPRQAVRTSRPYTRQFEPSAARDVTQFVVASGRRLEHATGDCRTVYFFEIDSLARFSMADLIQAIFVTPGLAFARLGGSSTPQFAYDWIDTIAPRADGETSIAPAWTIAIQPDGSASPFMPDSVTFRDGDLIRPVAPFYEIWARVGDAGSAPREVPLTPALLQANGLALAALQMKVTARNLKAARRTSDPQL